MNARSLWERSYEHDAVSLLNELGVPEAAYEGLARNGELINIPRESIERQVESIARFVVWRMRKYVRTCSCIKISVSIDRLNRRSWMIDYKREWYFNK